MTCKFRFRFLAVLVLTLARLQPSAIAAGSSLEAAIVPGADILLQVDLKSARQAPVYAALQESKTNAKDGKPEKGGLEQATRELEEKLGLKEDDIETILLSADLDNVKPTGEGSVNPLLHSQALLAVGVKRNISLDKIQSALNELGQEGENSKELQSSRLKIAGRDALRIESNSDDDPSVLVSVHQGRTIFLSLNEESLQGALTRSQGDRADVGAGLSKVMNSIPSASQIKMSFVVPQALRDTLKGLTGGKDNPEAPAQGPAAMFSGFSDLRSIALSMNFGEKALVNLSGDMGSPEAAQSLNMMLAFLKPQLLAGLAQKAGKQPQEIPANAFVTTMQGPIFSIALLLDQDLLKAIR